LSFILFFSLDGNNEQPLPEDHDPIVQYGPHLPQAYLKIIPHPKSMNQISLIIPLIGNSLAGDSESAAHFVPQPENRPWAPFRTLEDFEVTELAITSLMPKTGITKLLAGVTGKWSNGKGPVTLKTYSDMDAVLYKARKYVVQVCSKLHVFNYPSEFIVSSSTKKSLRNSMEKSILFRFNIEIPGSTFALSSPMNPSCRSICGTLSRNIIVRVFLKSNSSMNQTLQRHGGMLTYVPILFSQKTTRLKICLTRM
jgi:hypothetical protein